MSNAALSGNRRLQRTALRMTVRELAQRAGVTSDAVRYYVRIGLLQPERDSHNGYKLFSEQDITHVRFICRAKRLGYTLKEIQQILADSRSGRSPCPKVREFLRRHIQENRKKLEELSALQRRMEDAIARWETLPDVAASDALICQLIESAVESNDGPVDDVR